VSENKNSLKPGWKVWRFDQIATNVNTRIDNPSESGMEHYVGLEHLDTDSLKIRRWGTPDDVEATKLMFKKGDIIFGRRRAYQRKLGVAEFDGICSAHAMVLRAKPEVVLPEFLPFFMQSDLFMSRAIDISVGSLSPTINWKTMAVQEFVLPCKDEQLKIVELLSQFELQAERYNDALMELNKLKASLAQAEFVDSDVPAVPLNQLCNKSGIQIGPFGAQLHSYDYVTDGVPVVMPADMTNGKIVLDRIARVSETKVSELQQHKVRQGDILLPRRGELNRRAWVSEVEEGWLCGTGSIRIRVADGVNPRGVFYALSMPTTVSWLKANAVGTTMPNLNSKIVASIPIKLPRPERLNDVMNALDDLDFSERELTSRRQAAFALRSQLLNRLWGE
jgi:type I restriction enzyme S subunit